MLFRQLQIFQFSEAYMLTQSAVEEKLQELIFSPCLPSMPKTLGFAPLVDEEDAPLVRHFKSNIIFCMQIEEKILPATVIRQEVNKRIREIEIRDQRKIYSKERYAIKDETIQFLLPRAFSKFTKVYAYIDTQNNWLVVGTTNASRTEQFLSLFNKCFPQKIQTFEFKQAFPILTRWLKKQDYPSSFAIEKFCVLQDLSQQTRVIRCQQQDLNADSIQALIDDGCVIQQLGLTWNDRVSFILSNKITLQRIKFEEELLQEAQQNEAETRQQQFDADFLIASETLNLLMKDLLEIFSATETEVAAETLA